VYPPSFLFFYAVRVGSNQSGRLIIPRTTVRVMSAARLVNKNDCAGDYQQKFTQLISRPELLVFI
jgi:hypothetical protein